MERWQEVFVGRIPNEIYQTQMLNGENQGLIIELSNSHTYVIIKFGIVQAVRMLDEGIVQTNLYCDEAIKNYKKDGFRNVIYEVQGGEFREKIEQIAGGYGEFLDLKHYVVVTQNYNIDIISECEPTIELSHP